MKLPLSWLREWVEVEGSAEAIAEALTTRGFYVEGIERHGVPHPGIVVARVLEADKHPNADKLKLCKVDDGSGTPLSVVCGAPNVTAGMIVPLATVGTVMPNGMAIKQARIRGELSQGMLCSTRELMLSDDHSGILELSEYLGRTDLPLGSPIDDHLPPPDAVLEVEVPFNRPDGMGVIGLAREVKAALGGRWTEAARTRLAARPAPASGFALTLSDADCPGFFAQVVTGVRVGESPAWLQQKLAAMGQRSINNIVDLTNLMLFEYGQPMHAFDLAKLAGPALTVRAAREGESIVTLDGRERKLTPVHLLITDAERPVGVAGVMGGEDSEVSAATRDLLLECAWFTPARVRRSARSLGLATEASKRYERGVDPAIGAAAAHRFLELLLELCPGATLGPGAQVATPVPEVALTLRPSRAARLVGLPFTMPQCEAVLGAFDFAVTRAGETLAVGVPSWRLDCRLEDDLVEEVARGHGYDRIPEAPMETRGAFAVRSAPERTERRARAAMLARGLTEAWSGSLISAAEAEATRAMLGDLGEPVRLANPMSTESAVLRPNLVAGLLRATAHNLRQGAPSVRLFEVGTGFAARGGTLPEETRLLAAVVCGQRFRHAHDAGQAPLDFLEAKGLWQAWLREMGVDDPQWRAYSGAGWKPGASAEVAAQGSSIAWAGVVARETLAVWEIEAEVHLFVARLAPLAEGATATVRAQVPGRFPSVRRDLAFFVPRAVTHGQLEQTLRRSGGELLHAVELFDVYEGPGTPQGMKSLAYAMQFQHAERTLTEAEVAQLQDLIVTAVAKECDGTLRERG